MKTTALFASLSLALLLSACAVSRPVQGPSGGTAYFVSCGAGLIDKCYEEAAKVCPKGYTFADKQNSSSAGLMPVGTSFMVVRSPNTMLVECKT